ncbi:hypothetical protein [Streptomyces sp. CAS3]
MRSVTVVENEATTKAGTAGEDVLTVHELITKTDTDGEPYLQTKCESGRGRGTPTEWLRQVNCRECLAE